MTRIDAVELELFAHRFAAVAENMGEVLRRTALSTNVKERLDFSCGVLDAAGRLVANAPHVPVHLGALGECVRAVQRQLDLGPGDVGLTNHPAFGGSHLPDVTVVTPVFDAHGRRVAFVANRAHHAEIGGARPGSMPPDARCLSDEGVALAPFKVVIASVPQFEELEHKLRDAPYPSRAVEENLADVRAAIGANQQGVSDIEYLVARYGADELEHRTAQILERSGARSRALLESRFPTQLAARDTMDDGTPIQVAIGWQNELLRIDFTGSGDVHPGSLNATPAIVRSAVLYVLQLLADQPLPLNEGLLDPVELVVPQGFLCPTFVLDPDLCPAVVGGNVETSQRIVDTLLKALGVAAASQGTMNNTLFGNQDFGYYETICGGAGAVEGAVGASAVHTHMTNTAITDPEVLERSFPVRLERFEIREGSGGDGRWPGGDGVVRELRFLEPLELSLLCERRSVAPYGQHGGEDGAPGRQLLILRSGERQELSARDGVRVGTGDRLLLETPGGGGWGRPGT